MKLLSTQNFKTVKGEKFGILTGILYLAPAKLSGFEVCPKRSEGCTASCLYSAGMGAFSNVQKARIQKTLFYFGDRPKFLELIKEDIKKLQKQAKKDGQKLAIRLNGTSDLNWMQHDVFSSFPDVQFYDYTKVFNRLTKEIPSNYHLTFSKSENNDSECIQALKLGFNVAVVFDTKKGMPCLLHGMVFLFTMETIRIQDFWTLKAGMLSAYGLKVRQKKIFPDLL